MGYWQSPLEGMVNKITLEHFRNKKILVTGHTGFKGAWLTYLLSKNGANVIGLSLQPVYKPNLFDELHLENFCTSIIGNINDAQLVSKVISENEPDFIFHLAAQPLVRYSYKNPIETFETNVIGTANILNACRNLTKKCCVVCVTTDKVYHNFEWPYPYRESDKLGGHDPYSASKAAAELIIESFRKSYFLNSNIFIASARAGNVIGGGDWSEDRLIPDIVRNIQSDSPILLRNPQSIRPWQHVLDPLFGYLKLAVNLDLEGHSYSEAWNFGPYNNEALTVDQVAQLMVNTFEKGTLTTENQSNAPHEAGTLTLDISKSIKQLNWTPVWNTQSAIYHTANWYKSFIKGENPTQLIENDIYNFLNNESL